MNQRNVFYVTAFVSLILTGCLFPKNDECVSYYPSTITSAVVPATIGPQETANIQMRCQTVNGCGQAYAIETTSIGDTLAFKAISKYSGCVCTQALGEYTTTYQFTPPSPGVYYFKFYNNDGSSFMRSMLAN